MIENLNDRRTYLQRRMILLVPYESDFLTAIKAVGQACADQYAVHIYVFNPSQQVTEHDYDGQLYIHRLRGSSMLTIGVGAAYYKLRQRVPGGKSIFPLPSQAHGIRRWLWEKWIFTLLYDRCRSLSIAPRLVVATDPITLRTALRLKRHYNYPIAELIWDTSSSSNEARVNQMTPTELLTLVSGKSETTL